MAGRSLPHRARPSIVTRVWPASTSRWIPGSGQRYPFTPSSNTPKLMPTLDIPPGSTPAPSEQLVPLVARVRRGLWSLLRDPGLAAANRVRLEADAAFLASIDVTDPGRAAQTLVAYLPRVVAVVESVTPLYLRLHRDLLALSACATSIDVAADRGGSLPIRSAPPPSPRVASAQRAEGQARPGRLGPLASPGPLVALAWRRSAVAPVVVGIVAVVFPLLVLVSEVMAEPHRFGSVGPLLALGGLCGAAALGGMVARILVYPEVLPGWAVTRIDPGPGGFVERAATLARAPWQVDPPGSGSLEWGTGGA